MAESPFQLFLADGAPISDLQTWGMIGFAIVVVVVNIVKKLQEIRQRQPGGAGSAGTPPGQAESPQRPFPRTEARFPVPPTIARPGTMPPAAQRSASRPPTERAALGTRLDVTIGSIADIRPRPAAKSPLPAQAADGSDTASAMQARLTALLRDRTGLQAALLVSEILAPPVGWRDLP